MIRLSKREAELEAIRIAEEYLAARGGAFERICLAARPDTQETGYKRRKNVIKWVVLFERLIDGQPVDGPNIVMVDLDTRQAELMQGL
jgi:hypothetical protein